MVADGYKDTEIGVIPVEWDTVGITDVAETFIGLVTTMTKHYEEIGVPLIRNSDIKQNRISTEKLIYLNPKFAEENKNKKLKYNDVVTVHTGDIGVSSLITKNLEGSIGFATLNSRIINKKVLPKYLCWYFNSPKNINFALSMATGDGRCNFNLKDFNKTIIPLPPLKEQEKIADILSTADEKIDAIASQIQKAQTLKKGLLQKLLSEGLGHSEFKDSELGKIPESWEVVKLNDISKITMGQSPKSDTYNTDNIGMPLIQGNADCKNRKTIPRTYTTELTKECFVGDIIMTVRAPVGAISKSLHNACIGRGVCSIKSKEDTEYIYHCLVNFEDKWDKLSQGSTFTAVSGSDIKNLKFPLPPLEEQKQIAEILSTADEKLEVLISKKEKYETLKKGLLQKLLSGEVRV